MDSIATPTRVTEIVGGRYDGDYRVEAECPGCGNSVTHILEATDYGSHRVADCGNHCQGGYDVVRPMQGLLGLLRWWDPTPSPFAASEGPGLLSLEVV